MADSEKSNNSETEEKLGAVLQLAPNKKNTQQAPIAKDKNDELVSLDELYEETGQESIYKSIDRQTTITSIESIADDIVNLRKLSSIINDFFSIPHTKKEIRNFSEKYLLDNFLTANELNSLYSQLTIEESLFNSDVVKNMIYNSNFTFKDSLNRFKLKVKKCLSNILFLIAEINDSIIESSLSNKLKYIDSLFNKIIKIESIFQTARQLPVESNQIDDLPIADTLKNCSGLAELVTFEKNAFNTALVNIDLRDLLDVGSNSTYIVNPYLCKNNWLSLRNLIISLSDN